MIMIITIATNFYVDLIIGFSFLFSGNHFFLIDGYIYYYI